jgi:hypothetical protein
VTDDDTVQALENVGVDISCGACMEIAFTGVTTNMHTCVSRTCVTCDHVNDCRILDAAMEHRSISVLAFGCLAWEPQR